MQEEQPKKKEGSALKIVLIILLVIVIIFLLLIITAFAWFWFADPLGLRTAIFDSTIEGELPAGYDHPLLSDEQEDLLQGLGIDPRAVPTEITPEMEACAREKLGDERVNQIIQGSAPSTADLFKAQSCF